jgi:hypothetical protein
MTQTPQEIALEAAEKARTETWKKYPVKRDGGASTKHVPVEAMQNAIDTYHAKLLELGAAKKGHAFVDSNDGWVAGEYPPSSDEFSVLIIKTDGNKP